MKSVPFPGMNIVYSSPKDWDAEKWGPCGDLNVMANEEEKTVMSCWHLEPEEIATLIQGGKLYLTIHGGQPPVALEVR